VNFRGQPAGGAGPADSPCIYDAKVAVEPLAIASQPRSGGSGPGWGKCSIDGWPFDELGKLIAGPRRLFRRAAGLLKTGRGRWWKAGKVTKNEFGENPPPLRGPPFWKSGQGGGARSPICDELEGCSHKLIVDAMEKPGPFSLLTSLGSLGAPTTAGLTRGGRGRGQLRCESAEGKSNNTKLTPRRAMSLMPKLLFFFLWQAARGRPPLEKCYLTPAEKKAGYGNKTTFSKGGGLPGGGHFRAGVKSTGHLGWE